jgi:hypothetical protein
MRRVLAGFLGLALMAVGIRLLIEQSARNTACNAAAGRGGLQPVCQHIVFSYLASFGIVGAGFLVFLFGVMVMKRQNMRARRRRLSRISDDPTAKTFRPALSLHSRSPHLPPGVERPVETGIEPLA